MDKIFESIEEWMRNLLTGMVSSNLTNMFTDVNEKTGDIASQVGQTPQGWSGSIFSLIQNLSDSVIVPIAGMIITFVLCYELISMLTEKNNMHDIDTWMFFKYFFKMWVAVWFVSNAFTITMAIFDVGQNVVNRAAGVINQQTAINIDSVITSMETAMESMEIGELIILALETLLASLCLKVISVFITVILYGRMIEIYLYQEMMTMQEHEYKARDKTVQKMSRDGLREKNLRSKKEKRITGRETDEKKTAGHREQELDFGKVRKTHTAEETVEGVKEGKHRLQSRHAFLEQEEIAEAEEMENSEMSDDKAGGEKSPPVSRSRLRKDSIRGHPERKFERDSEITEPDRQNRKKKMVTAYAAKEQKLYHEKAEVDEKSMEDFREEIKSKTKREQIRKEQKKSKSRLSFEDESKGVIPGSGMAKRGASAVSETVSDYSQKKVREDTDDNAALDAADQMELAGESLARKSIYVRERLKENRQRNNRLKESVLEETEKFRLQFGTSASNEAKKAVQKEAEQKKQTALKKLLQKKRYQKQYQAAKQGKAVKDAVLVNAQRFTEKAKAAVKEIVAQNRNILLSIGVLVLLFALMVTSLSSCAALFQGSSNAIISTSYSSEDEDIYAAENAYVALENALNEQINQMKANHSDYDEFQFQIDEIGHNPYQLISYLTVKYGGFTYAEVADEIQKIFKEQYGLYTDSTRETVTEKKTVRVGESLGQVVTSGYCNCPICCGQWSGGPTASGAYPQANHTIAVDASNPFVPMGTHVIMNGVEYVVEDTGNFAQYGVQFDVFYGDHASASAHGHQTWEAYIADSNGSQEVEVTTTREVNRLDVTLTNHNLDAVLRNRMTDKEQEQYDAYNKYYGNRDYLFDLNTIPTGGAGFGYDIPAEALSDPQFAKMIREAEKYLGYPYVWGGASPSTSFDCSGFVCWVINNCGNGWNVGRTTADGLRSYCSYVSPSDAKPGDLIFFQGTYDTPGASHVGIYVGNNMMIHCGNPIQYTSIASSYWQQHFMAFGRIH